MSQLCPRCASRDILGKKFGFGDVTLYEMACRTCDLFEYRRSTDPDFDAWWTRWSPDEDGDEDADNDDDDADDEGGSAAGVGPASANAAPGPTAPSGAPRSRRDELLREICHNVADDAPRLAYADEIADRRPERAEFIRLQVERMRAERQRRARRGAPTPREVELRRRFGDDWARYVSSFARPYATDAPYQGWELERGFVAELRTDPDMVADPRGYVFESAPVEHLDLTSDGPVLAALASPWVAQVRSLGLRELGLGDDDMIGLARDGRLDRCEWLDLRSNKIGPRGVAALAAEPRIRAIPVVLLAFNPCDPAVQYSDDGMGGGEMWLPPEGKDLEQRHGRIPWLYLPTLRAMPDRYHAAAVEYVELD